jgi:Zn-dependent peptidase ImmA (M78 family)
LITPTAVFVRKGQFTQFRSSFELAEFLSHAAAHVRLKHAERNLETNRAEMETEAEAMAAEILMTADCAPGPCAAFGRLLAAARR